MALGIHPSRCRPAHHLSSHPATHTPTLWNLKIRLVHHHKSMVSQSWRWWWKVATSVLRHRFPLFLQIDALTCPRRFLCKASRVIPGLAPVPAPRVPLVLDELIKIFSAVGNPFIWTRGAPRGNLPLDLVKNPNGSRSDLFVCADQITQKGTLKDTERERTVNKKRMIRETEGKVKENTSLEDKYLFFYHFLRIRARAHFLVIVVFFFFFSPPEIFVLFLHVSLRRRYLPLPLLVIMSLLFCSKLFFISLLFLTLQFLI